MAGTRINKKIYKKAYEYLVEMAENNDISEKSLSKYFKSKKPNYKTLEDIFERLIKSAQNASMKPNVIKFGERRDDIKKILFDYNTHKIVEKYDNELLYEKFCKKFGCKGEIWFEWAKSVVDSARFINEFTDVKQFNKFIRLFDENDDTRWILSQLIELKLFGFGSALACDFLKEIGYTSFSKPDVHLIKVFESVGLSDSNPKNVFNAIGNMARICGETPYKVDKIFWLICSGNFYQHDVFVNGERYELIEYLNRKS